MSSSSGVDAQIISGLRVASKGCYERGLLVASKWSSELLLSISPDKMRQIKSTQSLSSFATSTPTRSQPSPQPSASFIDPSPLPEEVLTQAASISLNPGSDQHLSQAAYSKDVQILEKDLEIREQDVILAARAYFDTREFQRAINLLTECISLKAKFLRLYCQFIATEKKALRNWHTLDNNRHQPPVPVNESLGELLDAVKDDTDPWLLFLKALFLSRLSRREEAIQSALLSIAGVRWNWSAWTLLGSCIGDGEELSSLLHLIPFPRDHPLVQIFQIKTLNDLHNAAEHEIQLCDQLLGSDFFPNSTYIMSLKACAYYHGHDYTQAERMFDKVLSLDPNHVEDIDIYSNVLYVQDSRLKLSKLAHDFLAMDKDRPEVCCLVGNHYSLRAEHEKAVKYFRRATQLDRTYLPAWTLMGHEYVEMKNSQAAIEAYRRAVDISRKDYRAWFGLGQAYELLSMYHYSLYYYQRATSLRPYDVRLWQAQAMCYEELGRLREAVECYKRALIPADPHEISINLKLARIHRTLEEHSEAVAYHRRVVEVCQADLRPIQDYAKSSLEVADYEMRVPDGNLNLAREYLNQVSSSNAEDVGRAKEMLKVVESMIHSRAISAQAGIDNVDADTADPGNSVQLI
ncbi:TPR-like protein [Pholiota conissans]|uniref:TPR-like protein n=1 Tax=Pholiota conissans TaxID=109636 RepID=A0A9P5YV97_9AGAR|nr:TPR-like protein [Pholiota conissans]